MKKHIFVVKFEAWSGGRRTGWYVREDVTVAARNAKVALVSAERMLSKRDDISRAEAFGVERVATLD